MSFKEKLILVLILLALIAYANFLITDDYYSSDNLRATLVCLSTVFYFVSNRNYKSKIFSRFLIIWSVSEILYNVFEYVEFEYDYYLINTCNLISFSFLLGEVIKNMNFKAVKDKYKFEIVVLLALSVGGAIYFTSITHTDIVADVYFEVLYNVVLMILLSTSLLMYFSNSSERMMLLAAGVLCLVAGELFVTAFHNLNYNSVLNYLHSLFLVLTCFTLIKHSFVKNEKFNQGLS